MKNDAMNLSKNEMISMINDQQQEIALLKRQLAEAVQENKNLMSQLEDAQQLQKNYEIKVNSTGSLAEASAMVSGLFEAAQATADTYLENIRKREANLEAELQSREEQANAAFAESEKRADEIVAAAENVALARIAAADEEVSLKSREAEKIIADAEAEASKRVADADYESSKKLEEADAEIEKKWGVIEERLLAMYESHKGLKELMESGIFSASGK